MIKIIKREKHQHTAETKDKKIKEETYLNILVQEKKRVILLNK